MIFENKILDIYRSMAYVRCDDTGCVYYFTHKDFNGLHREKCDFNSSMGHKLCGNIYYYDDYIPNRIIIFDHGFGGGHLSYMKEIEMLCRHGFMVFAYDHTGCMQSGGKDTNGMAQSLCDLNDCVTFVKSNNRFANSDISVMGHSWGGFSSLNITVLHPDISHIVVLSGFVSVEKLVESYFKGPLSFYRNSVMQLERKTNPVFSKYNAVDILKNTKSKVLLIYSADDKVCSVTHYNILREQLKSNNIRFILTDNKGHNPNYTEDAVKYKDEFFSVLKKKNRRKQLETEIQKKEFISSFDWNFMTTQDEKIWSEIYKTLDE